MTVAVRAAAIVRPTILPHRSVRSLAAAVALTLLALLGVQPRPDGASAIAAKVDPGLAAEAATAPSATVNVIVRETLPPSDVAERLVRSLGGTVTHELPILGGFSATVPGSALADVAGSSSVGLVWGDGEIAMSSSPTSLYNRLAPNTAWRQSIRLNQVDGIYDGAGVAVALLDTGVTESDDLGDRLLARVDLTPEHDGFDRYGHGTHMSGIIAGTGAASDGQWTGVAPGADLVSVKVAGPDGSTDVSTVIAGLQWVVANRTTYNIRVLNLAFGTDSDQSYGIDPLDYAVEQAWFSGILVVASAGNRGPSGKTINKPGDDPFVLTVGAADNHGTPDRSSTTVATFSSWGSPGGFSKPDIIAPGITVVSLRDPGSTIDTLYPDARIGDSYFKGTGTSQAAAIVSGVAALMFQANPWLTPDLAKGVLVKTAYRNGNYGHGAGAGLVDVGSALQAARNTNGVWPANQGLVPSTGTGSLEASRGSFHVDADIDGDGIPDRVIGEIDALGQPWPAMSWSAYAWYTSPWSQLTAVTPGWSAASWSALSWSGTTWSAASWSAVSWSADVWS
jgi:serine protease AprX